MRKELKKMFCGLLCMMLIVVSLPSSKSAAATEEKGNMPAWLMENYQENMGQIRDFLKEFSIKDPLVYLNLLRNSRELIEANFNEIMEECKSKKKMVSDIFYEIPSFDWLDWGRDMVKARGGASDTVPTQRVKVALVDSGVNFSSDIDVVERKNFIPDHDEISVLYEDVSGHGTNIAGVIAAKDNGEGITGINPNVELYSAKVLDAGNQAPISRVIEGIEWAIEKEVNIINISFTTDTNSQELYDVIKKAYDKGILIVAAAGNNGYVSYPAAYPEVVAVGSINSEGRISDFSPSGARVELVAPGELITSSDVFDTVSTNSGTSYAAPYVTAVASLLWEKDLSCSSNFIRCVLDCSANLYGDASYYGYGLVDYRFAEAVYSLLKPIAKNSRAFDALMKYAVELCGIYNPTGVPTVSAPDDLVEGAWGKPADNQYDHRTPLLGLNLKNTNGKALLLAGCVLADVKFTGLQSTYLNPYFHGFFYYSSSGQATANHTKANYIAGGLYLTYVAKAMLSGNEYKTSSIYVKSGDYDLVGMIDHTYINAKEKVTWENVKKQIEMYGGGGNDPKATFNPADNIHRALVVYGLAIHSFTDLFAHSAVDVSTGKRIWHTKTTDANGDPIPAEDNADKTSFIPERYEAAVKVAQNTLRLISKMDDSSDTSTTPYSSYLRANISIFDLSGDGYEKKFKLIYFAEYADEVCNKSGLFKADNTWNDFFKTISVSEWK